MADPARRGTLVLGLALVVLGGLALAGRALSIDLLSLGWPIFVLAPGIALFLAALAIGDKPGLALAIPGGIVTMVGAVLSFQAATGLWATWAYAWALVAPGGVGFAMLLYGLLTRQTDLARAGVPVSFIGIGLFVGFGLFFEGVLKLNGRQDLIEPLFAVLLVVLGGGILLTGVLGRRTGA